MARIACGHGPPSRRAVRRNSRYLVVVTGHIPAASSSGRRNIRRASRLGTLCQEIDAGDEDVSLWPCTRADVPFVAYADLCTNRLQSDGRFRSKPIDSVAGSAKHRWQVCSTVVAHLPEREACESGFRQLFEQPGPQSSLDLNRVTACDVNSPLARIQLIACKRREEARSVLEVQQSHHLRVRV